MQRLEEGGPERLSRTNMLGLGALCCPDGHFCWVIRVDGAEQPRLVVTIVFFRPLACPRYLEGLSLGNTEVNEASREIHNVSSSSQSF